MCIIFQIADCVYISYQTLAMLKDTFFPEAEHMTISGMEGDIQVTSYITCTVPCTDIGI